MGAKLSQSQTILFEILGLNQEGCEIEIVAMGAKQSQSLTLEQYYFIYLRVTLSLRRV